MKLSHPGELSHVIGRWLDGREITDDPEQPGVARVLPLPDRGSGRGPVGSRPPS